MVAVASDHLWGCVTRATASGLEGVSLLVHVAEPKVHHLQTAIEIDQQVLGLEVPVANAKLVNVMNACDQLL